VSEPKETGTASGRGSFCIPQAAVKALLDAQADAVTIGAYLTLARFTDRSNVYSTAGTYAVRDYVGLNNAVRRGGQPTKAQKAIEALKAIQVGKGKKAVPLVIGRDEWQRDYPDRPLPDGPSEKAQVRHVLPDFYEPLTDRVWFSNELVTGHKTFKTPLKKLRQASDDAARLFLAMQQAVDMVNWGGVPPDVGPWQHYKPTLDFPQGNSRLIHAKDAGRVCSYDFAVSVAGADDPSPFKRIWPALEALEGCGLFYQTVLVLNKDGERKQFSNGDEYDAVPQGAEPRYELDARTRHGYKPKGEGGLGAQTARTAGELGHSVAQGTVTQRDGKDAPPERTGIYPGKLFGKYAAIVPRGYPAMVAGIFRPRFRPSNPKNAGVKDAWARIYEGNRDGFAMIQELRHSRGLDPLPEPEWLASRDTPSVYQGGDLRTRTLQ
jgi:hypothetical protein